MISIDTTVMGSQTPELAPAAEPASAPHNERLDNLVSPHVGISIHVLENGYTKDDIEVKRKFKWFQEVLHEWTGHKTYFFYDTERPDILISMGGFDSVEQEYEEFHKSMDFMDALEEFGGIMDVRGSFHASVPLASLEGLADPGNSHFYVFTRCWIADEDLEPYNASYNTWLPAASKMQGRPIGVGWRLEGGWIEQEALDAQDNFITRIQGDDNETDGDKKRPRRTIEEYNKLNEQITILGFDSPEHQQKLYSDPAYNMNHCYFPYLKGMYVKFLKPWDLSDVDLDEEDSTGESYDDDEENGNWSGDESAEDSSS